MNLEGLKLRGLPMREADESMEKIILFQRHYDGEAELSYTCVDIASTDLKLLHTIHLFKSS